MKSTVTFPLTLVTISVTLSLRISLCKGRRSRGCSRLCGASAVPAGGTTHSVPGRLRASSGRHYDRSVGCATGLGQAGAGNARNNCVRCCLRKEDVYRSAFSPRPRKPGLKSRAAGESPQVRAAVERRQASVLPQGHAAVPAARQVEASVCRRSASLSCFCPFLRSVIPTLERVIAGLDPAIHAEAKRDRSFGSASQAARHHGPPDQVRW